jgi:hypothetical protein
MSPGSAAPPLFCADNYQQRVFATFVLSVFAILRAFVLQMPLPRRPVPSGPE